MSLKLWFRAVGIGERNAEDGYAELVLERFPEVVTVGNGQGTVGESVIRAAEAKYSRSTGGQAAGLQRRLDRLSPGAGEDGHVEAGRSYFSQALEQSDFDIGWVNVSEAMRQGIELAVKGIAYPTISMTGRRHAEAGAEIDIDVAVDVEDIGPEGFVPKDWRIFRDEGDVA